MQRLTQLVLLLGTFLQPPLVRGDDKPTPSVPTEKPRLVLQRGHTSGLKSLALSPDGKQIISTGHDGRAILWDTATGLAVCTFSQSGAVAFSPDGRSVVIGGKETVLWSTATGERIRTFQGSEGPSTTSVTVSSDGKTLFGGAMGAQSATLWDTVSGEEIRVVKYSKNSGYLTSVDVSMDGKYLLTGEGGRGHYSERVHLWDAKTGEQIRSFWGKGDKAIFSPDGKLVLTWGELKSGFKRNPPLCLWDSTTGKIVSDIEEHRGPAAFSRDGKRLVMLDEDGTIHLLDLASNKYIYKFRGPRTTITHLALSPDGMMAITGSNHDVTDPSFHSDAKGWETSERPHIQLTSRRAHIQLWDIASGREIRSFGGQIGRVNAVALSQQGERVLIGHTGATALLYNLATGRANRLVGHTESVMAVALSPDGKRALTGSCDRTARLWDATSGKQLLAFPHDTIVTAVAFAPDGSQVLTASDETACLWDATTGEEIHVFGPTSDVTSVAFSPTGTMVATTHTGRRIRLWDPLSGSKLLEFSMFAFEESPTRCAFSPDGKQLLTDSSAWDLLKRRPIIFTGGHHAGGFCFSPDGKTILGNGTLADAAIGKVYRRLGVHTGGVTSATFSGDGRWVVLGSENGSTRLFDLARNARLPIFQERSNRGVTKAFTSVAYFPDGHRVMTAANGEAARMWDASSGMELRSFQGHTGRVTSVAVSPDGKQVVTGSYDMTARLWDASTGNELLTFNGHSAFLRSVAFSPNGKEIATASDDGTARIWNVATGQETLVLDGHTGPVTCIAFSPENDDFITGSQKSVRLWDVRNGAEKRSFQLRKDISGVAFAPDGKTFCTAETTYAELWDVASGRLLSPHKGPASSVAFAPNGRYMATCRANETVLWDTARGQIIRSYIGSPDVGPAAEFGKCVAFSPDSRHVFAGSPACLWDLEPDSEVAMSDSEVATLVGFLDGTWLITTPDGNYASSKGSLSGVGFGLGTRAFAFDQFDLKFNRPDRVFGTIGLASQETIAAYRRAYEKRLARMKFTEEMLGDDFHVPEVTLDAGERFLTRTRTLQVIVKASDSRFVLDHIYVDVNGVPLHGAGGINIRDKASHNWTGQIDIDLDVGRNRIEVSALNEKGAESLKEEFVTECDAQPAMPNLYAVAVGVSDYADARFRLMFAEKDARDLADHCEQNSSDFGKVSVLRILDRAATAEKVKEAKAFLQAARVDDVVVLFFAGHGLLDAKLNYYFATADIDFNDPAKRGLAYETIEDLLDGIVARKKLLLIDTCHSGEVDKEEIQLVDSQQPADGNVRTRAFRGGLTRVTPKVGLDNSYQLLQEMFSDLRRGTGAVVVSSAGAAEYALESDKWKNGVFTYSVLRGLKGEADVNVDGYVQVSELRDFVQEEVKRLTGGRQKPTARLEGIELDFKLGAANTTYSTGGIAYAGDQEGWIPLFNGKDLAGWKTIVDDPGVWQVIDGVLTGNGGTQNKSNVLRTERDDFTDFHLRVEARINNGGYAGVNFRTGFTQDTTGQMRIDVRYHAVINSTNGNPNKTGGLAIRGRGPVVSVTNPGAPHDRWFVLEVIAIGNRTQIKVDGRTTADYVDSNQAVDHGAVVLLVTSGPHVIEFRKVEIKQLWRDDKAVSSSNESR